MSSSEHPGFALLEKAYLTVLTFQFAILISMLIQYGPWDIPTGFLILVSTTAVVFGVIRAHATDQNNDIIAGWIVALRSMSLAIFCIATMVVAFHRYISPEVTRQLPQVMFSLMWVLICLKGAFIGKLRPGGPLGLRVYWTTHSRLAWDRAHRTLGRILFLGGLLGLSISHVIPLQVSFALWCGVVAIAVILALIESWRAWRADPNRT